MATKTPNQPPLSKAPEKMNEERRIFCDRAFVVFGSEHFVIAFQSGEILDRQYSFTPEHAKRLRNLLTHELDKFESEHRPIKDDFGNA